MKGKFIVIEGIEGAGKSTCISLVEQILKENNILSVVHTREPGGTVIAEKLRTILLDKTQEKIFEETELLLMYASRVQLVNNIIKPALNSGSFVIGDRHDLSSIAYQGGGRGMDINLIKSIKKMVLGDFKPDLTILMDIPPEIGLSRVDNRGMERDRFEQEKISFFEKVRNTYLEEAKNDSSIKVVDATKSLNEVKNNIRLVMDEYLCTLG